MESRFESNATSEGVPNMNWEVPQAEQIFLGSILYQPSRMMDVTISEDYLISEKHRQVFRAIRELDLAGEVIDILSVSFCDDNSPGSCRV